MVCLVYVMLTEELWVYITLRVVRDIPKVKPIGPLLVLGPRMTENVVSGTYPGGRG